MKIILLATAMSMAAIVSQASADEMRNDLGWLSGCWVHSDGNTRETWSADYGGLMFGYAVTRKDGAIQAFEDIRIEPAKEGLLYIPSPGGRPSVSFREAHRSDKAITFVNAEHDFPQRIEYRLEGKTLTAEISLADGSNAMAFEMTPC